MLEIIIGAFLATALLYIGKCWGQQRHNRTYHIHTTPEAVKAAVSLKEEIK